MRNTSQRIFILVLALESGRVMAQSTEQTRSPAGVLQPLSEYAAASWKRTTFGGTGLPSAALTTYNSFLALGADGPRRLHTDLAVTNSRNRPVSVLLEFFADDGKPLALPFAGQNGSLAGYYPAAAGTLPPGATTNPLLMALHGQLHSGWIRITADAPDAIEARSSLSLEEADRSGIVVHPSSRAAEEPVEVDIENSAAPRKTMLGIVNPSETAVDVKLAARLGDGTVACESTTVQLQAHQQIWRSASSMISCLSELRSNYTLNVSPVNGEIVVQSYYDYGNLLYHAAPVRSVTSSVLQSDAAMEGEKGEGERAATTVDCTPSLNPQTVTIGPSATVLTVSIRFPRAGLQHTSCEWKIGTVLSAWLSPASSAYNYKRGQGSVSVTVAALNNPRISTRTGNIVFNVRVAPSTIVKWKSTFTLTQRR